MSLPRFARAFTCLALILLAAVPAARAAAIRTAPNGYPRLAFYGSIRGNGYPFYNAPVDSALNDTVLDKVSRFEEIILDVNPIFPYRPDILRELRRRNPKTRILAYVVGHDIWDARDRDSLVHYPTRYRRLLDNNNGWLYNQDGSKWFAGNTNLAKKDASGRYVIADSLALLWKEVAVDPGIWDGLFFDILCDHMAWSQTYGRLIDYRRAGYNSFTEFDNSWKAATDTIAAMMRNFGGPDYILVGNCAAGTKYSTFNGWMREGFPYETGGEWWTNMFWAPGGYITDDQNFLVPRHNYIFSFQVGTNNYSDNNNRIMRFGLGSATLGDGFGVFGGQDRDAFHADYHNWWYDEYAVDLDTHQASNDGAKTGWLGQAITPMYQMVWVGTNPEGIQNPNFETSVGQGWQLFQNSPCAIRQDSTTAAQGKSSARIDIFQSNPVDWKVNFNAPINVEVLPWTTYSVTFWAKASSPRTLNVNIFSNGSSVASRPAALTTEWKQFQIPFVFYQDNSLVNPSVQMFLAKDAGTVWFDGFHVQQGGSMVWRRDFQNGTVLVNPSTESFMEVHLERPFHRILGLTDPIQNDGTTSNVQMVAPSDALFLVGDDVTPPNGVKDLHQVVAPH